VSCPLHEITIHCAVASLVPIGGTVRVTMGTGRPDVFSFRPWA
jgi:hypothetical protein